METEDPDQFSNSRSGSSRMLQESISKLSPSKEFSNIVFNRG
jgi:hypothetical protein